MPNQTQTGKAFEYALIIEAKNILTSRGITCNLLQDNSFQIALDYFELCNQNQQSKYSQCANVALMHILTLEPKLTQNFLPNECLTLKLQADASGKVGDVRDIILIRLDENWEIGISAKNNHNALKHSRLSTRLDFGMEWVGIPCSQIYYDEIGPIFNKLKEYKRDRIQWRNIPNKALNIYLPLLNAFKSQLNLINEENEKTPSRLISYLIGSKDFYKVIKKERNVEVQGFNLGGTLGRKTGEHRAPNSIPKLVLPTEIIRISLKENSIDTLEIVFNHGWQLSFRIHSASTLVEPSLKFDIKLIGHPNNLYIHNSAY